MEFNVCPQKHSLPIWWYGPCLTCDFSVGIEMLRERVGEMYGQPACVTKPRDETPTKGGRPKRFRNAAERQKAYRERSRE